VNQVVSIAHQHVGYAKRFTQLASSNELQRRDNGDATLPE
jgi:hypothetical protein